MKKNLLCLVFALIFNVISYCEISYDIPRNEKEKKLVAACERSIDCADSFISNISFESLQVEGYTGWKIRHLLNNLCQIPETNYFEVGAWKGATTVSALMNNERSVNSAIIIDNWSQFGGPRDDFLMNSKRFLSNIPLRLYEDNCFLIEQDKIFSEPITVYLYDGPHNIDHQYGAFTHFNARFDDVFIALVDDWNWGHVQAGTKKAFNELGYTILFEKEFFTDTNGDGKGWWNGFYVAVIRKSSL